MILQKKHLILITLITAALGTLLLATGISQLTFRAGDPLPISGILALLGDLRTELGGGAGRMSFDPFPFLVACLWIMLILSAIAFVVSSQIRKQVLKRAIIFLIWALIILGLMRTLRPNFLFNENLADALGELSPAAEEALPEENLILPDYINNPPQWITLLFGTLLIAIPLLILWLVWYRYWALKSNPDALEQITQEAQNALDGLQAGADLKDTIMRCYHDMSLIFSQNQNLHRRQAMTPREFEQHLANSGVRTEHIQRLTRLFESVRYGGKVPGRKEELEAMDCLNAIVKSYGTA